MKEETTTSAACVSLSRETRAIEEDFIETYKNLTLLWDTDHKHNTNKYKRNEALDILLKIIKRWNPSATRMSVRQKINILRSTYRKDRRKYLASKCIGPKGEEIYEYEPRNWKFHALKFLERNSDNDDAEISEINVDANNLEDVIMTTKKKHSALWNHFEEVVPSKKAKCSYCSRVLSISVSSIGSLRRHMRTIHPTIQIDTQEALTNFSKNCVDNEILKAVELITSGTEEIAQVEDETSNASISVHSEPLSHTSDVLASVPEDEPPRKKIKARKSNSFMKVEMKDYYEQNDNLLDRELQAIGANVSCKLKRMNSLQRYHAELLINKVLIAGLKNNLSDDTDLTDVYRP